MNAVNSPVYGASPAFGGATSSGGLAPWSAARWAGAASGAAQAHSHGAPQGASPAWTSSGINGASAWSGAARTGGQTSHFGASAGLTPWSAARWSQPEARQGGGAEYVDAFSAREALSGMPYVGWAGGGTTNATRDQAVNAAIASGNLRNYVGTRGPDGGYSGNLIGALTGGTIGAVGDVVGKAIAEVPVLGNHDNGIISTFSPILNVAFGQRPMDNDQIKRNAIYNFGPRADAYLARGDAFGRGVASGLRGEQVHTPPEQSLGVDGISHAINAGLGAVSRLNIPVISYFADAARSLARGASGESTFDFLNGGSSDPMDPTWTVFAAPVNLMVSGLARSLAPVLGLDQAAMDERFGRAVGDAMNVYDIFLPGDHTRHAWGSHLPRLAAGSPHNSNDHSHHHQFQPVDVATNTPHTYVDTWRGVTSQDIGAAGGYRQIGQPGAWGSQTTAAPQAAGGGHQGHH